MWASRLPASRRAFPDAVDEFLGERTEHGSRRRPRRVLWDTPVRFYGLEERFTR